MRIVLWAGLALCLVMLAGCQQEMADEGRYKPLEASPFFPDGRSARHLVPGTVARDRMPLAVSLDMDSAAAAGATDLPLPLSRELLARGHERYNIYCSPCHDRVGTGQGMIVQRGYPPPPSLHIPRLRQVPPDHFVGVITNGVGVMPSYKALVPPPERWAIAAYIRVLQLSQYVPVAELPAEVRQQLEAMP